MNPPLPSDVADVDKLVQSAVTYASDEYFLQITSGIRVHDRNLFPEIASCLDQHGPAFDKGLISLPRVLDVIFKPFIAIAATKVREEAEGLKDLVLSVWFNGVVGILGSPISAPSVRAGKRAEIVQGMLDANIPEVSFILNLTGYPRVLKFYQTLGSSASFQVIYTLVADVHQPLAG